MNSLDELVAEISASSKYRHVAPGFIRSIGEIELAHQSNHKLAVKATRNKLHQVGGAYFDHPTHYSEWIDVLLAARTTNDMNALKSVCRKLMVNHASTRERVPILDEMYSAIFENLPVINSISDYACGLNPLAIPWMKLPAGATYSAIDIYQDLMSFISHVITLFGYQPEVQTGSILDVTEPRHKVDLALLLKVLPCLEQLEKGAGKGLLERIDAKNVVVSFPV
ncbi:MAG TPA: 16S rRNA methyltransferase, partial [Anaerolineae bacterium]